jgi:YbbR domain-containing protein
LLDPSQTVTATVHVTPLQMTETIQAQASIVNKGADVDTTGSPPFVSLTVSGPSPILSQLANSKMQVVLDVSGKGAGHYDIAPQVQNLPQGITLDSAPQTVAVDLASTTPPS